MATRRGEFRSEPDSSSHWNGNGDYIGPRPEQLSDREKYRRGSRSEQDAREADKKMKDRYGRNRR